MGNFSKYLVTTETIESDHPDVVAYAKSKVNDRDSHLQQAVDLYYAVRDEFRYDPYQAWFDLEGFKASHTLSAGVGWCVPKAILYVAGCRALGIPARLGFADVRNHLSTERIRQLMKTDVFCWHGYASVYLKGKWVKATPAFNVELCTRFGLKPLEFDGYNDSIYHAFDQAGNKHMEYLRYRGEYADLPLAEMKETFDQIYGGFETFTNLNASFEQDVEQEVLKKVISMTEYETVTVEKHGSVAVVTMSRPESLNAVNHQMMADLYHALTSVNEDDSIRVGILTGAGSAFGSGGDLKAEGEAEEGAVKVIMGRLMPVLAAIRNAEKPWISAVNGACAGVSTALAMCCDLTVMAERAYLLMAFTNISLVTDGGVSWCLARTLGPKRAYEMVATGEKYFAPQCLAWGLCNRVVPDDELLANTLSWAEKLSEKAPLPLRIGKQIIGQALESDFETMVGVEANYQDLCVNSEDSKEGIAAFREKRAPNWQ